MPSTDATLAWAIQVDILSLGPHLEAYANLQPTFDALRLSNRFGLRANITTLPPELISLIEDFMVVEERARLLPQWSIELRCYRLLCEPVHHVASDQLERLLKRARFDHAMGNDPSIPGLGAQERVSNFLADRFDIWCDTHYNQICSWQNRCGLPSTAQRGIFTRHKNILKKHFGLNVWISHVRLEDYLEVNYWAVNTFEPAHTTVAFLTLPGATRHFMYPILSRSERNEEFVIESGYGMPVHVPAPLSDGAQARFTRMMQILDLKPYIEESQRYRDLYAQPSTSDADDGPNKESNSSPIAIPQLTMLVRHCVRADEDG